MRDIPVFSTENGIGSLFLKEIPYREIAYIRIQSASEPETFLRECIDFCKAVGAEKIYAAGHACLESYPFHTAVYQMTCHRDSLEDTDAALFPVTERTLSQWLEIYNRKMADVANASYMTHFDGQKLLKEGSGYFIHRGNTLLGIGTASMDSIGAVISLQKGAGKDVVLALKNALFSEKITLEVASVNQKAVDLYDRLGFIRTAEVSRWYRVL